MKFQRIPTAKHFSYWFTLSTILLLTWMSGCGGASSTTTADSSGHSELSQDLSTKDSGSQSAAAKLEASSQTVAVFLDSLRRGDETTANSMLTTKARQELQKTAWVMQPLGTPEGRYTLGRAGFPYDEQNVVLVECRWQEPAVGTESELLMDIVCELYEESEGWRIAGMAVTVVGEEDALVIDFEDGIRLQEMLDLANGVTPPTNASQTIQPDQPNNSPAGGLPALPEYPSSESSQIAMPPDFGGVLR